MAPSVRLFVALWPSDAARAAAAAIRDAWTWSPSARPTRDTHLHVTVRFIGAVPTDRVDPFADALARDVHALDADAFALALDRVALWNNGIAVLEPSTTPSFMTRLHDRIDATLDALDVAGEARAYRPHVTLARDADGSIAPTRIDRIAWSFDDYALVESRRGRYTVLRRYALLRSSPP